MLANDLNRLFAYDDNIKEEKDYQHFYKHYLTFTIPTSGVGSSFLKRCICADLKLLCLFYALKSPSIPGKVLLVQTTSFPIDF